MGNERDSDSSGRTKSADDQRGEEQFVHDQPISRKTAPQTLGANQDMEQSDHQRDTDKPPDSLPVGAAVFRMLLQHCAAISSVGKEGEKHRQCSKKARCQAFQAGQWDGRYR